MKEFLSTTFNLREQTNTKQANLMDLIKNLYAHEGSVETQMQFGSLLHAAKYTRKEIMQLLNVTISRRMFAKFNKHSVTFGPGVHPPPMPAQTIRQKAITDG